MHTAYKNHMSLFIVGSASPCTRSGSKNDRIRRQQPTSGSGVCYLAISHSTYSLRYLFLDFSDIDVAFFVVTVDLWSADGKQETNLVLHPSAADRYIPASVAKQPRRRPTGPMTPSQRGPDSQVCVSPHFQSFHASLHRPRCSVVAPS